MDGLGQGDVLIPVAVVETTFSCRSFRRDDSERRDRRQIAGFCVTSRCEALCNGEKMAMAPVFCVR